MIKKILVIILLNIFFILPTTAVATDLSPGSTCDPKNINSGVDRCIKDSGGTSYSCQQNKRIIGATVYTCQIDIFGQVKPPSAIENLGIGSIGISKFLNNLIVLIYILASVIFVFMLLWGAFQWLTSGGNKEAIDAARKRIIHAIIGIILFAITFAILNVLGIFTGFTFFLDKNSAKCTPPQYTEGFFLQNGKCIHKVWRDNVPHNPGICTAVFIEVERRLCP